MRPPADPPAVRREMISRAAIALVWATADIGQVVLAWAGGIGDRAGDEPLVVFAISALVGGALLCAIAAANFAAAGAAMNASRLTRLTTRARVLAWLCAVRLPIGIGLIVATRSAGGTKNEVPTLSLGTLVILAVLDGLVVLSIAAWTAAGLRRAAHLAQPGPLAWHR